MRVLVTGHRGYIGSVLTSVLKHARHDVVGLDCDLYSESDFGRVHEDVPSFEFDVREISFADLLSFDAVIHLAALSNDACAELDPALTHEINYEATVHLAKCCKQAGVSRFVFASSCSVYGRGNGQLQDELSSPNPKTAYAKSKLACELSLAGLADSEFSPVSLRLATVYGVSPRLRLDTVVNDFVASGVITGTVGMRTFGSAWRPLAHVEDVARVFSASLAVSRERVHNRIFNVARREENYRVIDIADAVAEHVPDCTRSTPPDVCDELSYRVDGAGLKEIFPHSAFRWTLPLGIRQLRDAMLVNGLSSGEWRSARYRRAPSLQSAMERKGWTGKLGKCHTSVVC